MNHGNKAVKYFPIYGCDTTAAAINADSTVLRRVSFVVQEANLMWTNV